MSTLALATSKLFGVSSLLKKIDEMIESIERGRKVRQTILELSKLTDKELRDIGISRNMIHAVAVGAHYDQ